LNLLLDTRVVLWTLGDVASLSASAREAIEDGRNRVLVSAVSAWEIVIKRALGKLRAPDELLEQVRRARFTPLDVTIEHALAAGGPSSSRSSRRRSRWRWAGPGRRRAAS
jgi:PIN domain nuclease of toxin-antitoxin system